MKDKYSALWVSYSSIKDFLECPRTYFLKNVYRDRSTGHKIQLMTPSLALGSAVHEVLESLSVLPVDKRLKQPLIDIFDKIWEEKYSGLKGGFFDEDTEYRFRERGENMIRRVMNHPNIILKKAIKIKQDLPHFWLSEKDNIILCGKIDWLEYLEDVDGVHIVDFKTSKKQEKEDSLQLQIYHLLVHYTQKRKVYKASYWYLDFSDTLTPKTLYPLDESYERVLKIAKKIKTVRALGKFSCKLENGPCYSCKKLEKILQKKAIKVKEDKKYRTDVYVLEPETDFCIEDNSVIL